MVPAHPQAGEDADLARQPCWRHAEPADLRGATPVRSHTYEITFAGQAGTTLRAEFDDCEVTTGSGTTTLRAQLPDQAALSGLVQRITGLGLELIHMRLVAPPPER